MRSKTIFSILLPVALLTLTSAAWANDSINFSGVSSVTAPYGAPVISGNKLTYTFVGTSFPCNDSTPFASFSFTWAASVGSGQHPTYPTSFSLGQIGGDQMTLTPNVSNPISVESNAASGSVTVNVYIPTAGCSGLGTANGTTITGHVSESTTAGHLNTSDQILVNITLVYPTNCMNLYVTESNQDTLDNLDQVAVVAPHSVVKTTNPGTISVEGLVVNQCDAPKTFDIGIDLGQYWTTQPSNNPGNATFLFTTSGEVDLTNYALADWGTGTPEGEITCIPNVTLSNGSALLARVHAQIVSGTAVGFLPADSFPFSVTLYAPNTSCQGSLLGLVNPNPAANSLPYTVK